MTLAIQASLRRCRPVRSSGFFHSAYRAPLSSRASPAWPWVRAAFQTSRRTWSSASLAHSGHVEWVGAQDGGGTAGRDHPGDPGGRVGADQPDLLASLRTKRVKEAAQRRRVVAGRGPHQPASVVVDHHGEVAVALLVGDLVDPDPGQPLQPVAGLLGIGDHAGNDPPHRRPRHPQQLVHRLLGGVDRQPRRGVVERAGMAGAMARPGHAGHHHSVLGAADPGCLSFQVGTNHAKVQRPPAPPALPLVEAGAAPATPTAAAPDSLAGPHRHHQRLLILVEADPFDDRLLDTEQPCP